MCEERQNQPYEMIKIYNADQSHKGFKKEFKEKEESKVEEEAEQKVKE